MNEATEIKMLIESAVDFLAGRSIERGCDDEEMLAKLEVFSAQVLSGLDAINGKAAN
jgi:hypothetical protein